MGLKNIFPWWAKIGIKIIMSRVPLLKYENFRKINLFRHGTMDDPEYAINVFKQHVERAFLTNKLHRKMILEIGPGDSIITALIAKSYGAKSILIDVDNYATKDIAFYKEISRYLIKNKFSAPSLENISSFQELLDICDSQYLTNGLLSFKQINDNSVDFVFSHAVLEHIRLAEFELIQTELYRVLKPSGTCSHTVDLRDHLGGQLNNLRFKHQIWESDLFASSGFYTNRIQLNRMMNIFESVGFEVQLVNVRRWDQLPTPRKKMAPEFALLPEDILNVSGFDILLKK